MDVYSRREVKHLADEALRVAGNVAADTATSTEEIFAVQALSQAALMIKGVQQILEDGAR